MVTMVTFLTFTLSFPNTSYFREHTTRDHWARVFRSQRPQPVQAVASVSAWREGARPGSCGLTEVDGGASCARGTRGAWRANWGGRPDLESASAICLGLCARCERCRFVGVGLGDKTCDWFHECPNIEPELGSHVHSGRAAPARPADGPVVDDEPWRAPPDEGLWDAPRASIFEPLAVERFEGYIGIGALFGTSFLQSKSLRCGVSNTVHAWRQRANASLVLLTDFDHSTEFYDPQGARLNMFDYLQDDWARAGVGAPANHALRPELVVQTVKVSRMRTAWGIAKRVVGSDGQWYRVLLLTSFVRRTCMAARGVMLLDLKDMVVQLPPWMLVSPGRLSVFEEETNFKKPGWNRDVLKLFLRPSAAPERERSEVAGIISERRRVINSGIMLGTPSTLLTHLLALCRQLHALGGRHDRWVRGVDQPAHNLVVYRALGETPAEATSRGRREAPAAAGTASLYAVFG